jgi:hypothetical protein
VERRGQRTADVNDVEAWHDSLGPARLGLPMPAAGGPAVYGIARSMNSSNKGTVKAKSPCAGL